MKRTLAVALAVSLAALLLPMSPASAHDQPRRCGRSAGDGAGWWKLRAHGVKCRKARKVANRWEDKCIWKGPCNEPARVNVSPGWRCWWRQAGYETVFVRCEALEGSAVVHFLWGS